VPPRAELAGASLAGAVTALVCASCSQGAGQTVGVAQVLDVGRREVPRWLLSPVVTVVVLFGMVAPVVFLGHHLIDLAVYREGGQAVLHGRDLYAPSFARRLQPPLAFTYPPLAAVLAVPVAVLPHWLAGTVWTLGEMAVLVWVVDVFGRSLLERVEAAHGPARAAAARLGLAAAAAWVSPVNDHLGFGQVNLFLLALVAADLLAPSPRWPRGLLIGVATAVKLVPGVFVLFLLVTGRRTAARTAVLSAVGCSLLAAAVRPATSVDYWTGALFETGRIGATGDFSNQSIRGVVARLTDGPAGGASWVAAAAVVLVLGLRRARAADRAGADQVAVVLVAMVGGLVSPITWIHHLVWLVPAVLLLVGDGGDVRRRRLGLLVTALLWARLPYLGQNIVRHHGPLLIADPLRDAYGAVVLAVLALLPFAGAGRGADRRATRAAWTPAPYPLSMLTTTTPGAQEDSIPASAASPPAPTP